MDPTMPPTRCAGIGAVVGTTYAAPVSVAADIGAEASSADRSVPIHAPALATILNGARLRVLRATVLIALLISLGNLVGAIAGYTASRQVTGPAVLLGAGWCLAWALAAAWPRLTARWCTSWRPTMLVLVGANVTTVAVTGGIESPLLSVCMYVGWIASVVAAPRIALGISLAMSGSIVGGYLLAGNSVAHILSVDYRYGALTSAALPVFAGLVGVALASVTNATFGGVTITLDRLRGGLPATSPGLTALLAGRPVLELPPAPSPHRQRATPGEALTDAEREVVRLLAEGHTPKQIAYRRGVGLSTVRSQLKRAKAKTGASTLAELVRHVAS